MKLGEIIIIKVVAFLFERFTKGVNSTATGGNPGPTFMLSTIQCWVYLNPTKNQSDGPYSTIRGAQTGSESLSNCQKIA